MNFKKEISKAIKDSLASLGVPVVNFSLETPKLSSFGDYATNAALLAGKKLKKNFLCFLLYRLLRKLKWPRRDLLIFI